MKAIIGFILVFGLITCFFITVGLGLKGIGQWLNSTPLLNVGGIIQSYGNGTLIFLALLAILAFAIRRKEGS